MSTHSTALKPRSKYLQELVLSYFRLYPGEAEVIDVPRLGAVHVVLSGALAARLEDVTQPHPERRECRLLRLLLDPQFAAVAPGYEIVASHSPLLRRIQNNLADASCRYARAIALVNLDGTFADLAHCGVKIRHASPIARATARPRRFLIVSYLFRQSAYEKNEDTIRIVVDALTARPLAAVEAARFSDLHLVDMQEARDLPAAARTPPSREVMVKAIEVAQAAAHTRLRGLAGERLAEMAEQLRKERDQVQRHYQAEIQKASTARRAELEKQRQSDVEELDRRYAVRTELTLVSVQEVLVPSFDYTLLVPQVGNGTLVEIPQKFVYDPLADAVSSEFCDRCGKNNDAVEWAYCGRGNHLECACKGGCDNIRKCYHRECTEAACDEHGVRCSKCGSGMCANHELACGYCTSPRRYCADHILKSYEDRSICPTCSNSCAKCRRLFPPALVKPCGVCRGLFCGEDLSNCPGCKGRFCASHGGAVSNRTGIYCHNCHASCSACAVGIRHLKSDLEHCTDCGKALCQKHAVKCISCGDPLCGQHQLLTPAGPGCTRCFAACRTCGATPLFHRGRLQSCALCPPGDASLHCADKHARDCSICGKTACGKHRVTLTNNLLACRGCTESCVDCGNWFDRRTMVPCHDCGKPVCAAHAVLSEFADEQYCQDHSRQFVACPGCDRTGPQSQLATCGHCGVSYCCHCLPVHSDAAAPAGSCIYCRDLRQCAEKTPLDAWLQPLKAGQVDAAASSGATQVALAEVRAALEDKRSSYHLSMTTTRRHQIIRGIFRGGMFGFITRRFKHAKEFVLVHDTTSNAVAVRINPTQASRPGKP